MKRCTILRGSRAIRGSAAAVLRRGHTNHHIGSSRSAAEQGKTDATSTGYSSLQSSSLQRRWEPNNDGQTHEEVADKCTINNDSIQSPQTHGVEQAYGTGTRSGGTLSSLYSQRTSFGPIVTLCSRKYTTSKSPSTIDLPVSPLMDPDFLGAREKHKLPKQIPTPPKTSLQLEVSKNPFARALASPVRRCGVTRTVLPRYFLQDFKMLAHPVSNVPYFVPTSLASRATQNLDDESEADTSRAGTIYAVSNMSTVASIGGPKKMRNVIKMIPPILLGINSVMEKIKKAQWRNDMDEFVLELMRRRCVESLVQLNSHHRGYLVGCVSWEDASSKPSVAAFLWTGVKSETASGYRPTDYSTLDLGMKGGLAGGAKKRKRKVPVYDLQTMLGPKKLEELKEKCKNGIFGREIVVLKHKNMTIGLQMQLWKLQGYVGDEYEAGDDVVNSR